MEKFNNNRKNNRSAQKPYGRRGDYERRDPDVLDLQSIYMGLSDPIVIGDDTDLSTIEPADGFEVITHTPRNFEMDNHVPELMWMYGVEMAERAFKSKIQSVTKFELYVAKKGNLDNLMPIITAGKYRMIEDQRVYLGTDRDRRFTYTKGDYDKETQMMHTYTKFNEPVIIKYGDNGHADKAVMFDYNSLNIDPADHIVMKIHSVRFSNTDSKHHISTDVFVI